MAYWLVKSDPENYPWDQMKKDKITIWDGVRNYQARNNLKLIKLNDILFFYISNEAKAIMGTLKVTKEYFQDPTTEDVNWVSVEVRFDDEFRNPVTLAQIKQNDKLQSLPLIKHTRLSVMPVSDEEFSEILRLSK